MISADKLQRGLQRYIDEQVLPQMSGTDMWVTAGAATIALAKLNAIKEPIDAIGIIQGIKTAARLTPAIVKIPFSSATITLKEADLDIIQRYIEQA